ncbi:MAG: class I SAM-dependent methyltransferase [Candidatus Bathyarchaeota archaeon]|nr:class I SAM-dependent methyltransferase [Candidatus Bathyarchaeota archaeon]
MPDLWGQYRCPTGQGGRIVAESMNRAHEPLTLWGLGHVKVEPDWVVLDVGCGGGKTVNRLAHLVPNGKVIGLDYSPDMVTYSKEFNKKLIAQNCIEIVEGSVEKTGFPDGFFDLVTAFETYYFWSNLTEALTEIKRVLKPNGQLLLVNEMVKDGKYEVEHAKLIKDTYVRLIPLKELRKAMLSVGFGSVQAFMKAESPWNTILAQKQ